MWRGCSSVRPNEIEHISKWPIATSQFDGIYIAESNAERTKHTYIKILKLFMVLTTDTLDWFNCPICAPWNFSYPTDTNVPFNSFENPTFKLWMTFLNNALSPCRGTFYFDNRNEIERGHGVVYLWIVSRMWKYRLHLVRTAPFEPIELVLWQRKYRAIAVSCGCRVSLEIQRDVKIIDSKIRAYGCGKWNEIFLGH